MTPPKTFPVSDPSIPKIAEIVPVVKYRFRKVAGEISAFYNSCENSSLCIYLFQKKPPKQAFFMVKTCWRRPISLVSKLLIDLLQDGKFLRFIMTKASKRFVISLDFRYVLHHYNAKGSSYIPMTLLSACA